MANDSFDPSIERVQDALWGWAAQYDPSSELYMTLAVWCDVIDSIGDDLDGIWLSRCMETALQADLLAQYAYVYGLSQEQLPPTVDQLRAYIQAVSQENGTVISLVNELMALVGAGSLTGGPVLTFPATGGGLIFPNPAGTSGLVWPMGGTGFMLPTSFTGQSAGLTMWQFATVPSAGLIFPAGGGGLLFPILPLIGSNPYQSEAMDGTTAGTVVGTGAGLLPLTFASNPFITVIQSYPSFVVEVQSYLMFDRAAFRRAVARFQPAHLLPGTVVELNTI
jgi:hypothetical protein